MADLHALGWRCWRADANVRVDCDVVPGARYVVYAGDVVTVARVDFEFQKIYFWSTRYGSSLVLGQAVFLAFFTALGVEVTP